MNGVKHARGTNTLGGTVWRARLIVVICLCSCNGELNGVNEFKIYIQMAPFISRGLTCTMNRNFHKLPLLKSHCVCVCSNDTSGILIRSLQISRNFIIEKCIEIHHSLCFITMAFVSQEFQYSIVF